MTLRGEVTKLESHGDDVLVTVTNVRQPRAAAWREYGPALTFYVPHSQAGRYLVGRLVKVTVAPR